jgi:hypothetical protein
MPPQPSILELLLDEEKRKQQQFSPQDLRVAQPTAQPAAAPVNYATPQLPPNPLGPVFEQMAAEQARKSQGIAAKDYGSLATGGTNASIQGFWDRKPTFSQGQGIANKVGADWSTLNPQQFGFENEAAMQSQADSMGLPNALAVQRRAALQNVGAPTIAPGQALGDWGTRVAGRGFADQKKREQFPNAKVGFQPDLITMPEGHTNNNALTNVKNKFGFAAAESLNQPRPPGMPVIVDENGTEFKTPKAVPGGVEYKPRDGFNPEAVVQVPEMTPTVTSPESVPKPSDTSTQPVPSVSPIAEDSPYNILKLLADYNLPQDESPTNLHILWRRMGDENSRLAAALQPSLFTSTTDAQDSEARLAQQELMKKYEAFKRYYQGTFGLPEPL